MSYESNYSQRSGGTCYASPCRADSGLGSQEVCMFWLDNGTLWHVDGYKPERQCERFKAAWVTGGCLLVEEKDKLCAFPLHRVTVIEFVRRLY